MNMTRRGFMQSMLALAAAPAIVRAGNIMRVYDRPALWGKLRLGAPILMCGDIIETTEHCGEAVSCSYAAPDVGIRVQGAEIARLWADGRLLWEKGRRVPQPEFDVTPNGVLRFKEPLDLTLFNNSVPRFDVEARA